MKVYGVFTENEHLEDFSRSDVIELNSIKDARALFDREISKNLKLKLFLFRDIEKQFPDYKFAFGRTGGIHFGKI